MGLFEKIKNALFEEEYVEIEEKPKKPKKEVLKKEVERPIAKKVILPKKEEVKIEELDEAEYLDEDFEIQPKREEIIPETFEDNEPEVLEEDLDILETNINESRNNTTRFAVFSRNLNTNKSKNKMGEHFILVFTVLNEAGALAKTLNIIGSHGFNMRTLRSRPMKELQWNYYFFVEADGDINSSDGKDMIVQLRTVCDRLKVVGSYYSQADR